MFLQSEPHHNGLKSLKLGTKSESQNQLSPWQVVALHEGYLCWRCLYCTHLTLFSVLFLYRHIWAHISQCGRLKGSPHHPSLLSIAVTTAKSDLGRKGFISAEGKFPHKEKSGEQGRNLQAGTEAEGIEVRYFLAWLHGLLNLFSYLTLDHPPGVAPPTAIWSLPHPP